MSGINASQLASEFGVSKGAVSQWVSSGKLDGCFDGAGRQRRFDVSKCAVALNKNIDAGQRLGNAAKTLKPTQQQSKPKLKESARIPADDPSVYEMARTQKAIEEARKLKRGNAEAEGLYVLASEVGRQVSKQIGQEVAEFETVMRDGARKVADQLGVDFKVVRKILVDQWRIHRKVRVKKLDAAAATAEMTDGERSENI